MRSRLLRALLTLAAFVAAWLVVSPVLASQGEQAALAGQASLASPATYASFIPATLASPRPPESAPQLPRTARAPLCDPRGAITFAPPPQMQDLEVSLDTGLTIDDCLDGTSSGPWGRAAPGRAPAPIDASSASVDAAVITAGVALAASARELLPAPVASTTCSRPGIRSTVDRPPRA